MTKIDIFSGFLGAGKTTLIKKLIQEAYAGQKLVLIENEFGEIGVDGGFLQEAGIQINEMNSGCICCSLVGDFAKALQQVMAQYAPDRILIEPSGVGKLSDVIGAVEKAGLHDVILDGAVTVADANKVKMYSKNFGEFYNNQIEHAGCVVLSRTGGMKQDKLDAAVALLREINPDVTIITTPWEQLEGAQILAAVQHTDTLEQELAQLEAEAKHHHHHHHDHDEDCDCGCHDHDHEHHHRDHEEHEHHHHHDHDEHCDCGCHDHDHEHHHHDHEEHEHHHHHHDEDCDCGCHDHDHEHHHHDHEEHEHHHHHDHDEHCDCGCDHDHHHHHHHADEIFSSWGVETAHKFTQAGIEQILETLEEGGCGIVLRAKGIVADENGSWIHFDYVPGETDIRTGSAAVMGRLCVIGSKLDEAAIARLFGV